MKKAARQLGGDWLPDGENMSAAPDGGGITDARSASKHCTDDAN